MMNKETTASTTQYSSLPEQQQGGDDTPLVNAVPITTTTEQTVDLVAPVDLSGGYLLDIDVNGTPAVVRVVRFEREKKNPTNLVCVQVD